MQTPLQAVTFLRNQGLPARRRPKVGAQDAGTRAGRGRLQQLVYAWATYARQPTAPAAVALALLYCTVMSMVRCLLEQLDAPPTACLTFKAACLGGIFLKVLGHYMSLL